MSSPLQCVLGGLEIKEFFVFSGSGLEKHETTLVYDHSDTEMLVHSYSVPEDGGWLRLCYEGAREAHCRTDETTCPGDRSAP
jgi:hypothetical protein